MSDERATDMPPALTPEQWKARRVVCVQGVSAFELHDQLLGGQELIIEGMTTLAVRDASHLAALIALANDALTEVEPRKFARRHIAALRDAADRLADARPIDGTIRANNPLRDLADALESYLPPRKLTDEEPS